ncbi:hypothetical protein [Corallococcus llansteffanensis]|uniref:Secreted protein n=1 Tax=Corallococcus llansteffanensis TaxID=2316731 RepID=A0A3A8Q8M8_9BACT|nr:hypothetical protein [Corallococcus llansteffanensis]RKH62565.1 hypothetical protein D7V93_09965 [Corallococcus llansteffanensis]
MKQLGIVLAGLLTSGLASAFLTACCPDRAPRQTFKLPAGIYGMRDNASTPEGDTGYRLTLSGDGHGVVEEFKREGKTYRQEYRVTDRYESDVAP